MRNDFLDYLVHSAKGSTWKEYKYWAKHNGIYYYGNDADHDKFESEAQEYQKNEIDRIEKYIDTSNTKLKELNTKIVKFDAQLADLNADVKRYEFLRMKAESSEDRDLISKYDKKIKKAETKIAKVEAKKAKTQTKIANVEAYIAEESLRLDKKKQALTS